jgi:hypothetical protein
LDEAALLTCMAYVDLNPIRAGLADTPEESDFTSIQVRLQTWQREQPKAKAAAKNEERQPPALLPFGGSEGNEVTRELPYAFKDYLDLVDWSGRAIRDDKRGHIPNGLPPILVRLGIEPKAYLRYMTRQENSFIHVIGNADAIRQTASQLGQKFLKGIRQAEQLFIPAPS